MEKWTSTEARRRNGGQLRVGSLGALIRNLGADGAPVVRVFTRRDERSGCQQPYPRQGSRRQSAPQDVKKIARAQADAGSEFSGLIGNVKDAHRLVLVRSHDWG